MNFTSFFIRRPVFATVISLIILLTGLRAFTSLPVREYPNIESSVINITTTYPGANAKLMEGFVTTPLENALGAVQGIDYMTSESTAGMSSIVLNFNLGYDLNTAIADVQNAVSAERGDLPNQVDDPIVSKQDPNADPTFYMSFSSTNDSPEAVTDYLLRVVVPQLQILPGVSQATIFGERKYSMRLWLDPQRMAAHNITASDINTALSNDNVQAAPGQLKSPYLIIDLQATTDLTDVNQFNSLILKNDNGYLVRMRDVGFAALGAASDDVSVDINGNKNVVVIGIIPQATANPLDVANAINKTLPHIKDNMPPGMNVKVIWDSSKFIAASLKEVRKTIFEAIFFVVIIIFLFLGSIRAVLIPVVTIPLSIIGVCIFMLLLGYTINTLTLLAWVLAIGLVVDDAIVVLENIHRHMELGENNIDAAIHGAQEIGFAIIAMTLTLAAVYAPIGFLTDLTGRLFREFAFTLAGAVIVSGFIALTLSPMMCSKLLRVEENKIGLATKIDEWFAVLTKKYKNALAWVLDKRIYILIGAGLVYLSCYFLYITLSNELAPDEDQGAVFLIMSGPTYSNLKYIEKYSADLNKIYDAIPEKEGDVIVNGAPTSYQALSFLILKPWDQRSRSADEIISSLYGPLSMIPGVNAFPMNLSTLPGASSNNPISFVLKTTGSYDDLGKAVAQVISAAKKNPGLTNIDSDLRLDKPEVTVVVDRNKANVLGISSNDIANALNTLIGQPTPSRFDMNGRSYDVIPQLSRNFINYSQQLNDINLRTSSGKLIPLSNIVTIVQGVEPQSLNHFQQQRAAVITAGTMRGYTQGDAVTFFENLAKQLPPNIQYDFSDAMRQYIQASGSIQETFLFAIIFIFLILAAQFESFRDPLIVMMSVPLSISGALIAIHLSGGTLNIYTKIGLVTLIGLITKHGILIVDFANKQQEKGLNVHDAVIEAATLRLRPILMTTGAMLLGALPLAIASGAGAVSRSQLGWTIFGGLAFGTCLTLFVVPTVYTLLASKISKNSSTSSMAIPD